MQAIKTAKRFITAGMLVLVFSTALVSCGGKAAPATDFKREANDRGGITVTGYVGQSKTVVIPGKMDGKPVTDIGAAAFKQNQLTSITIGKGLRLARTFDSVFEAAYSNGGRQAGTYTRPSVDSKEWTKK